MELFILGVVLSDKPGPMLDIEMTAPDSGDLEPIPNTGNTMRR